MDGQMDGLVVQSFFTVLCKLHQQGWYRSLVLISKVGMCNTY